MAESYLANPDLKFIKEVASLGGEDVKKCFQCATCSVACPISPENKPFPRKEMIATSWGLKDKILGNSDIWLCHNCGDCSTMCPRGAKPGDVLSALRAYAISEYASPKVLAKMVPNAKALPILLAFPAVLFIVLGFLLKMAGLNWLNFSPGGDAIVPGHFFSHWLVDLVMMPAVFFTTGVFAIGLKRFVKDMHENAIKEGKTTKQKINALEFIQAAGRTMLTILKHDKFEECGENKERTAAHMMVLYGFIGLFIVTSSFFIFLYVLQIHGPYSQLNPIKWLANISGVILVIGSGVMISQRLRKKDQKSTYKDWQLIGLTFALGLTGMLTEMARLGGYACFSYAMYFIHLVFVWSLFAYLPFTKLAHLVYRTVAMIYAEYSGRK